MTNNDRLKGTNVLNNEFLCPFTAVAKNVKIRGLEEFRSKIVSASENIACDYPEFNSVRQQASILLEDIDREISRLRR